jgi:hypothetical protein
MPTPRTHLGVVAIDGLLYAVGGQSDGERLSAVEIYDSANGNWTSGENLPVPMSNFAIALLDGHMHVLHHREHLVYSADSALWTAVEPMPTPRHATRRRRRSQLYVLGGCHEQLFDLDTVERFVPA